RHHPVHGRKVSTAVIPKERSQRFRRRIKEHFRRRTTGRKLQDLLRELNPILRGWSNFYRHAWGAFQVLKSLDHYVWWTIYRWLRKKHHRAPARALQARYCLPRKAALWTPWHDGSVVMTEMARVGVQPYRLAWERPPVYAIHHGEPGA